MFCNKEPIEIDTTHATAYAPVARMKFYIFLGHQATVNSATWKQRHPEYLQTPHVILMTDDAKSAIRNTIFLATYFVAEFLDTMSPSEFSVDTLAMIRAYMSPDIAHTARHAIYNYPRTRSVEAYFEVYQSIATIIGEPKPTNVRWGSMELFACYVRDVICTSNICVDDPSLIREGHINARPALSIERVIDHDTEGEFAFKFTIRDPVP